MKLRLCLRFLFVVVFGILPIMLRLIVVYRSATNSGNRSVYDACESYLAVAYTPAIFMPVLAAYVELSAFMTMGVYV